MNKNVHIIADLFDIPANIFVDSLAKPNIVTFDAQIEKLLCDNHMTCLGKIIHNFDETSGAVTCLYGLAESHLSLHSWPEKQYISLDCYTCGACDTTNVVNQILDILKPMRVKQTIVQRGDTENKNITTHLLFNGDDGYDEFRDIEDDSSMLTYVYKNHKIIYETQTKYQQMMITKNENFGTSLFLDGVLQLSSRDTTPYNVSLTRDMMSHFAKNDDKDLHLLVIGGGDGFLIEHLLRHYDDRIGHIDWVELDDEVVTISDKYFRNGSKCFGDSVKVHYTNDFGDKFVQTTGNIYDGIIIDCTDYDIDAPSSGLFSAEFYADCAFHLTANGYVTQQYSESTKFLDDKGNMMYPIIPQQFSGYFTDSFSFSYGIPHIFLNMVKTAEPNRFINLD